MPDKGKIISQTFYEKQNRLLDLYKDLIVGKKINENEAVKSLKMIGFSETIAASRVREWALITDADPITDRFEKQMLKERTSLEKYVLQMSLGKKNYIQLLFKEKKLTRDETVKKLIKAGCKEETAREMVNEWEIQR